MHSEKDNPASVVKPLEFKSVRELYATPEESVRYIVENLLPSSGLSILAGKPKAGKSTLARQLAVAVAQGNLFLDRATVKGGVLYLALEEKISEVKEHFELLGLGEHDEVLTYCQPAPDFPLQALEESLKKNRNVQLAIIDPIFRFVRVKDGNDYSMVNAALEPLLSLARNRAVHIMAIHHRKKRQSDDSMDDVLGSTAIAGAVDTIPSSDMWHSLLAPLHLRVWGGGQSAGLAPCLERRYTGLAMRFPEFGRPPGLS